jgi:hypothetical protein
MYLSNGLHAYIFARDSKPSWPRMHVAHEYILDISSSQTGFSSITMGKLQFLVKNPSAYATKEN